MTVYAEAVFLENFVIDAALLSAVDRTLHAQTALRRKALGAAIGALFAAIMPLISLPNVLYLPLKLTVGAFVSKWGVKTRGKKRFLLSYLLFLGYTFLLGGALIGLGELSLGTRFSVYSFPQGGMATLFATAYFLFFAIRSALLTGKKIDAFSSFYYEVSFLVGESSVSCRAYFDSGNRLQGEENAPIFVGGTSLFTKLLTPQTVGKMQSYSVCTAAGERRLPLLPVSGVTIRQGKQKFILQKAFVLMGKGELFPVIGCDLLLGTETFTAAQKAN